MKKILLFASLTVLSGISLANEFVTQVKIAKCKEIARTESTAGAVAGGTAGAAAGAVAGNFLFGEKGQWIGGALGGLGGGVAGGKALGDVTYSCVIKVVNNKNKEIFLETLGRKYSVGEKVSVTQTEQGYFVE